MPFLLPSLPFILRAQVSALTMPARPPSLKKYARHDPSKQALKVDRRYTVEEEGEDGGEGGRELERREMVKGYRYGDVYLPVDSTAERRLKAEDGQTAYYRRTVQYLHHFRAALDQAKRPASEWNTLLRSLKEGPGEGGREGGNEFWRGVQEAGLTLCEVDEAEARAFLEEEDVRKEEVVAVTGEGDEGEQREGEEEEELEIE
ncbi:Hypothetical protein NocV09_03600520 [Nannochloropsis oceanica]